MTAAERFERAWRSLSGMWQRRDAGRLTGRNSTATERTEAARFSALHEAYLAMDEPTARQTARYGYAERRTVLGRASAESHKATCQALGEW